MLRQLYPIMLSITIAMAIGVYMHPGEARKWIQQAGQWGSQVLDDTLRATSALADETRFPATQPGYASTIPAADPAQGQYPSAAQDPNWTYIDDGTRVGTSRGAAFLPPTSPSGYPGSASTQSQPNFAQGANPPISSGVGTFPRVLAGGLNAEQPPYRGETLPASSPQGATNASQLIGDSPYASAQLNPLRPTMAREAPWTSDPSGTNAAFPSMPPVAGHDVVQPTPQVGAPYPRVQWAGDWKDYRGVPETVKPAAQSQYGYLPSPNIDSTAAKVDRYLPNQPSAALPGTQATGHHGQSLPPVQPEAPSTASYQPPPRAASPEPVVPAQPDGRPSSSRHSIRVVEATPFRSLAQGSSSQTPAQESSSRSQPTTNPGGVSLPQQAVRSGADAQPASRMTNVSADARMASHDPVADLMLCEGAQILTRVGDELILGSEVFPKIDEMLSGVEGVDKMPKAQLEKERKQLAQRLLQQQIEMKLLFVDAKRNLPPEAIENVKKKLGEAFEESEVPNRLKKLELGSRRELEEKLMGWGTSLEREKHAFIEKSIAQMWVGEKLRAEEELTHEELLDYYQAHVAEYEHPTRVRWEHLEITFAGHPDRREAWQLIASMGNAVQQRRPFAQVAQERSEGAMASSGGKRDWITQGSLKSDVIDEALFSLPVGTLSPILEDETGFHIVRVIEREDAYRTPFEEIQGEIRDKLQAEHKQARLKEFVERLREEIPVQNVFEQQTASADAGGPAAAARFY